MKTKSIIAISLAIAVALLSGCNSADENNKRTKEGELTRVVLTVEQPTDPQVRGVGDPIAKHRIAFTNGYILFAKNGTVTNVFEIGTGANQVNLVQGNNDFDDVDGGSTHIYILGNVSGLTVSEGDNVANILNTAVSAKSQTNNVNFSDVSSINLYGATTAIDHTSNPSTATIQVKPIGSRIEFAQFSATGKVYSYQIDGIYINNFYNSSTLEGKLNSVTGNDLIYYGREDDAQNPKNFIGGGGAAYAQADHGYFFNENLTSGVGNMSSLVCKPASGVWAWNLLAPEDGEFPHMVMRVSKVNIDGVLLSKLVWITVAEFIYDGGSNNGATITKFEPGKIYTINDFVFDEDNLWDGPEMKQVSVKVSVELVEWEPVAVKPW